jgi:hypothetical protein
MFHIIHCGNMFQPNLPIIRLIIQWKPLIIITLGLALFDYNNRLITLSGGYNKFALFNSIVTVQLLHA